MLFSSQLFGRIWLREVRGLGQMERPHGSSRCFAFVDAQLIKNNKPCHPRAAAIWGTTRQQLPAFSGELLEAVLLGGKVHLDNSFQALHSSVLGSLFIRPNGGLKRLPPTAQPGAFELPRV